MAKERRTSFGGPEEGNEEEKDNELMSVNDGMLQETVKNLAKRGEKLGKLDGELREALNLQSSRGRVSKTIVKTLSALVPRALQSKLPTSLVKYCAEENDVLEYLETLQRDNINNIQLELRVLAACAAAKRADVSQIENDLKKAEKNKWSAKKLQSYMAERANIKIYKEVSDLLDKEFKMLTDEQREERKQFLLGKLQAQVNMGIELIETMGKVCTGSLQVFHAAVTSYADYTNALRPLQKIRGMAQALTDTNTAMYAAPDAYKATFKASIQALIAAVEAAKKVDKYSISSGNVRALMESGRQELDKHSLEFKPEIGKKEEKPEEETED